MSNTAFPYTLHRYVPPRAYTGAPTCLYPRPVHHVMLAQEELMIAACALARAKRMLGVCDDGTYAQVIDSLGYLREHVGSVWRSIDSIDTYDVLTNVQ